MGKIPKFAVDITIVKRLSFLDGERLYITVNVYRVTGYNTDGVSKLYLIVLAKRVALY